ncbi:MAG: sigma-E factor negative regulatory protein [Burkholderiaceae bacterium]|jgi:sigma-E factor negative regulatory protein RseA|nr:sigma-E factor negative regulatory protein [Burkholderiaceae bacterium]
MSQDMSREQLSTLMDGEGDFRLQSAQAVTFVRQAASDDAARRDWLIYTQIGDVLRSSDLTPLPNEHDFLQRVSAAIAREPIVLQPQVSAQVSAQHDAAKSARAAAHRRPHWSTRMTAGMAAVAGVAVMAWVALPGLQQTEQQGVQATAVRPVVASAGSLASSHSVQVGVAGLIPTDLSAQAAPGAAQIIPVSAQMPMVEYLLAHQQMAGGMMPVVPATLRVVAERSAAPSALSH